MPKIGPLEILVILIVALLIFGPKNLPKLGSALGKTVKNLRDGVSGKDASSSSDDSSDDEEEKDSKAGE